MQIALQQSVFTHPLQTHVHQHFFALPFDKESELGTMRVRLQTALDRTKLSLRPERFAGNYKANLSSRS